MPERADTASLAAAATAEAVRSCAPTRGPEKAPRRVAGADEAAARAARTATGGGERGQCVRHSGAERADVRCEGLRLGVEGAASRIGRKLAEQASHHPLSRGGERLSARHDGGLRPVARGGGVGHAGSRAERTARRLQQQPRALRQLRRQVGWWRRDGGGCLVLRSIGASDPVDPNQLAQKLPARRL